MLSDQDRRKKGEVAKTGPSGLANQRSGFPRTDRVRVGFEI
jgi:hypothetical protein